jgi:citryl-CoA lyase
MCPPDPTILADSVKRFDRCLFEMDAVSDVTKDRIAVRDVPIESLIGENSFTATVFLMFEGRLPDACEEQIVQAVLVALVDHGKVTPSIEASAAVQRGGNPLHVAVGAGILGMGSAYGGAIDEAATMLREAVQRPGEPADVAKEIVGLYAGARKNVPGYGHSLHDVDPRTTGLMQKARDLGVYGRHCAIAEEVARELDNRYRERHPLNIGGAAAAVISELGGDSRMARALYILSRTAGTIAHALQEIRGPHMDVPVGFGGSHDE